MSESEREENDNDAVPPMDVASRHSGDTNEIAETYVEGFDVAAAALLPEKKRPRQNDDDVEGVTEEQTKKMRPSFLPLDMYAHPVDGDVATVKMAVMNAYLDSCSEYAGSSKTKHTVLRDVTLERDTDDDEKSPVADSFCDRPTENTFWRDGEEVILNDGDDGLSNDFRVRCVFQNVLKTLNCFSRCRKTASTKNKALKDTLCMLERDIVTLNAKKKIEKHYLQVVSVVKSLVLAVDTSKGSRKAIVNQLHPVTCCLSDAVLKKLCRFNGFGSVNNYGYLECKFNIPVKLIFLGNLETVHYEDSGGDVHKIEPCRHFGTYFYECLENIYEICFDKLQNEVRQYRKNKALRDARVEVAITQLKTGDMSSLMRLESSSPLSSTTTTKRAATDVSTMDGFFQSLQDLTRRDNIRILGTSGRMNSESRLRYTRYNDDEKTVTEDDPEEEVDALFVSSFIRFRIQQDGGVHMDVYTRQALRLETVTPDASDS